MKKINIAAQLYTLREHTKNIDDFKKALKQVKQMGYDSFQYSGAGPLDPTGVKDIMDELQLPMSATHTNPDLLKNDLQTVIEQHHLWNCPFVGIGMMPEKYRGSYENIVLFAKEFSSIGKSLKSEGLTLVYHNHHFEFQTINGKRIMDILFDESDSECFDFELDTYWVQAGGADPIQWIYKMDGRMKYIHFKDMAIQQQQQIFAPVGEGNLNWNGIIQACMETDVTHAAVEQDECDGSPFDCLKSSCDFLKKTLK